MTVLVVAYDLALTAHLLHSKAEPDIDMLKRKPEDIAASESDRKAIKWYHDEMERQATSANQALGIFTSFTTKSVQNDLAHILDDTLNHPRHKIFQLHEFFTRQTTPSVAIGEKIKMEIGDLPQARNYMEILSVANSIRDLQAELTLVNPTATLTLSEMVSKLLSKIQDREFQMLRYQISEWEELRLAALAAPPPTPPPTRFSSSSSSSMTSSSASSPFSAGGGGGLRVSSTSLGTLVAPLVIKPVSVSVQFRPVIDLIQKFHLSMSSVDSGAHPVNSVDVIINGAGDGSAQQNLTGNPMAMWGMPRPDQMSMYGMPRADFFSPDFRLPAYLQWMSQFDTTLKSPGNGGYMKQVQRKMIIISVVKLVAIYNRLTLVMNVAAITLIGGRSLLGGIHPVEDVATTYLIVTNQLLGGNHLIGGNATIVDLLLPAMIPVIIVQGTGIMLNGPTGNVTDLLKLPVSLWIWMKMMRKMMMILPPQTAVTPIDYCPNPLNVHIATRLSILIRLSWIKISINRFANHLRFHFFLLSVPNAKGDEELGSIEEVVITLLLRVNCTQIKPLSIAWNTLYNPRSEMNRSPRITLYSKPINILLI
jgi:hypothetical protein